MARLNLVGQRFGRLLVLEFSHIDRNGGSTWLCKCACGKSKVVSAANLRSGYTQSCGCSRKNQHEIHSESRTRLYGIWIAMKSRCNNPKNNRYHIYGARGIKVCTEWERDYSAFRGWAVSNGYRDDLTIDRIDNDKGYCPENCRWATPKEQGNNKTTNLVITYMGETHTLSEWAEKLGIDYHTLLRRYHSLKWSIKDTLTTPVKDSERLLELNSQVYNMADWGRITGFGKEVIRSRLRSGWSVKDALTKPVNANISAAHSSKRSYTYKGFTGTLKEISQHVGMTYTSLLSRMHRGWSLEDAIETPISDGHHARKKNSRLTRTAS